MRSRIIVEGPGKVKLELKICDVLVRRFSVLFSFVLNVRRQRSNERRVSFAGNDSVTVLKPLVDDTTLERSPRLFATRNVSVERELLRRRK